MRIAPAPCHFDSDEARVGSDELQISEAEALRSLQGEERQLKSSERPGFAARH